MKRAILFALAAACAALVACAAPSAEKRKEAAARMQMGVTYLGQRNMPAAMRELQTAAELDPGNAEVDMVLGLVYQSRGDFAKAEESFREAIDKKPDYGEAHNNLGILLSSLGRSQEAIAEFEAAVSNVLYATPEIGYTNLGEEYRRKGDLRKSEEMFRRAIAFNGVHAPAWRGLAMVQGEKKEWAEAVKTLERCVEIAPAFALAWLDLGSARLRMGKDKEALAAFRNVLAHSTDPVLRTKATGFVNILQREKR